MIRRICRPHMVASSIVAVLPPVPDEENGEAGKNPKANGPKKSRGPARKKRRKTSRLKEDAEEHYPGKNLFKQRSPRGPQQHIGGVCVYALKMPAEFGPGAIEAFGDSN